MDPVKKVSGKALPLGYSDVDTDQIVPSDALKRIERTGFGRFLFKEWREDPDFMMNRPEHEGAVVLLAGENFGPGWSREHAPWALQDYGFGAIIAPSFADIFKNNCAKIGLLAVELPEEAVQKLVDAVRADPQTVITVELTERTVTGPNVRETFEMDAVGVGPPVGDGNLYGVAAATDEQLRAEGHGLVGGRKPLGVVGRPTGRQVACVGVIVVRGHHGLTCGQAALGSFGYVVLGDPAILRGAGCRG